MRFKFLIILTINIVFSQALFNRFIGDDSFSGSVKSTSMGSTHLLSSDLNSFIRFNPSKLSSLNRGISFSIQGNSLNLFERRATIMKDSFGDFLTEGDYVWNDNSYYDYNTAIAYSMNLDNQGIGIGISYFQLTNFNYNYEEETRGKYSSGDGEAAVRDPFIGYHVLSSEGDVYAFSYGFGWHYSSTDFSIALGYSMNSINKFKLNEFMHVDTMYADVSNLSNIPHFSSDQTIDFENSLFTSSTIQFDYNNRISCAIGIESKNQIKILPHNYEIENGLYTFINNDTDSLYYNVKGLNYVKPGKLSLELMLTSPHVNPIKIVFGYDKLDYDEIDISQWKFGFEYITQNKVPLRGGVLYHFSPIPSLSPSTKFSVGSGFNYKKLEISYGSTFSLYNYSYPDLFPVEDDVRLYYDRVYESKLELLFSIIYNF